MKKFLLVSIPVFLCVVMWIFCRYEYIDNRIEKVFYPDSGMVQTETDAVRLCCFYFKSVYDIELQPDDLCAKYYKSKDAWYIKKTDKTEENREKIVDGGLSALIRKKDGKVLMHSVY